MQSQEAHCKQRGRSSGQVAGKPNAEEDQEVKPMRQEPGCRESRVPSEGSELFWKPCRH